MVAFITGVVKVDPEPNYVPPVALAYQLSVADAFAVAERSTVPTPQREPGVVEVSCGLFNISSISLEVCVAVPQVTFSW